MPEAHSSKAIKPDYQVHDAIRKSDVDKCEYRVITLPNNLQVLLIHESQLDKSSAALDVHVGSFGDPKDTPGLAHFLEHLLFMGTDKYPKENDYMEFLAAHGGSSNAFTDDEHTNYFFEVSSDHFEPALDRFAQFFIAPLFNESGTAREMLAVDSEHKKNVKDDNWRLHQLERSLSDPGHVYSNFGTGYSKTLDKPGIRDAVIAFYNSHYSANLMKAVLYGKETLEELAEWAHSKFSQIPNCNRSVPSHPANPWMHLGTLTTVKSIKEMQSLMLGWQTGDVRVHNRSKPDVYLSHLIGHEGAGSLLSYLRSKDLVLSLSAGFDDNFHGFSFFQIQFDLTPKGVKSVDEIIKAAFEYIHLLKSVGPQKWIHDECAVINEMNFRFKDKSQSSSSYTYKLAGQLQEYSPERVLSGPLIMEEWNPDLITQILDQMTFDNSRAFLSLSSVKANDWEAEPWYGTRYQIQPLNSELAKYCQAPTLNAYFSIPKANDFIPANLEYIGKISSTPSPAPECLTPELYFKQDDQFGLPKSCYFLLLKNPAVFECAKNSVMAGIYIDYVKNALTELTYDATLAGLEYELTSQADGIDVKVSGFSDKALVLLERILKALAGPETDGQAFASVKDRYVRGLKSLQEEKPIWHSNYYANGIMQERLLHWRAKLAETDSLEAANVLSFGMNIIQDSSIVLLVDGNETKESASKVLEKVKGLIKNKDKHQRHQTVRAIKLPESTNLVYYDPQPLSNQNSAIDFYLQICSMADAKERQSVQLFVQIFAESFFDQLRTKEQLGYMVYQQVREKGISVGIKMAIQSERDPKYLEERIEFFLAQTVDKLQDMPLEEFEKYKSSLISDLTAKKKKLKQEAKDFWEEIIGCRLDFSKHLVDAAAIPSITKDQVIESIKQYVLKDAPKRKKLVVHIWSDSIKDQMVYESGNVIDDISKFIQSNELYNASYDIPVVQK